MTELTGAQAFVACLREEGIRFVFSVPGGQTLSILDALHDAPEIRVVTARHESAAASMADAYGRITGKPAVVIATTGPGATNLVTGVCNALRDSVPMIVVSVNNHARDISHDEAQDADHVTLMRQFVKFTRYVPVPENVVPAAREALRIAVSGNPGPAHIDFARDALETGRIAYAARQPHENRAIAKPVAADLSSIAEKISNASRPAFWVGRGVIISEASRDIVKLAEALHAPVVTTYNGIGGFPGEHPLCFGSRSKWGGRPANRVLAEADLLVVIGNSLNSISTTRWTMELPEIVQIDLDPLSIGKRYPVAAGVVGDARDAVRRLTAALAGNVIPAARRIWVSELVTMRDRWVEEVMPDEPPGATLLDPKVVMKTIAGSFGPDAVYVYDAGNAGIWAQIPPVSRPRHYMKPVGFGAMGFALPAAIAAKLAQPASPVLAAIGDGSLAMTLGEIETAVREQSNVIVLVFNDRSYGNIKQLQMKQYGQRRIGVDLGDLRFAEIAKAMGADGERVSTQAALRAAFETALKADRPYVIDAIIDPSVSIWDDPF